MARQRDPCGKPASLTVSEHAAHRVVSILIDAVTLTCATEPDVEDIARHVIGRLRRYRKVLPWLAREMEQLRWCGGGEGQQGRWERALASVMRWKRRSVRRAVRER